MMSGHDLNPIFCKKKSCTSKTLDNPPPLRLITSHSYLTPPTPLKVDVIFVSPLIFVQIKANLAHSNFNLTSIK